MSKNKRKRLRAIRLLEEKNAIEKSQKSKSGKRENLKMYTDPFQELMKDAFIPKVEKHNMAYWMIATVDEILNEFATLPGAQYVRDENDGDRRFVYVPPIRKDAALLVAHSDHVWSYKEATDKLSLRYSPKFSCFFSSDGKGNGADDRAGIAILWQLRKSGHALLIPNAEESGCLGSRYLMEMPEWRKKINTHCFAIEFDRMHDKDLVFYDVGAPPFIKWCHEQFVGYKEAMGSTTDIRVLCKAELHEEDCLDGVNISVGYYDQHCSSERLMIKEWQETLDITKKVLEQEEIPHFLHRYRKPKPPPIRVIPDRSSYLGNRNNLEESWRNRYQNSDTDLEKAVNLLESLLVCSKEDCEAMVDESEVIDNDMKCPYCDTAFV